MRHPVFLSGSSVLPLTLTRNLTFSVCRCWRFLWISIRLATSWAWALWLVLSFIFVNYSSAHAQYSHFLTAYLPAWTDCFRCIFGPIASIAFPLPSSEPRLSCENCCSGAMRYRRSIMRRSPDSGNYENWTWIETEFPHSTRRLFVIFQSSGYHLSHLILWCDVMQRAITSS